MRDSASRWTLWTGLLLLAVSSSLLHWRIHPPVDADGNFHVAKLIGNAANWTAVLVVSLLFLSARTAALGFLVKGLIVILGTVMMGHFSLHHMWGQGLGWRAWVFQSTACDIGIAWAGFFMAAALFRVYAAQAVTQPTPRRRRPPKGEHIVIVGGGVAAVSAAEGAREADARIAITMLSEETGWPYQRLNLTPFLAGMMRSEELALRPATWFRERKVDCRTESRVVEIDAGRRFARTAGGEDFRYDRLILAVGAHPVRPAFPGEHLPGVHQLRTREDAQSIALEARSARRAVVIGGGILGLEAALALARRGKAVEVVETVERILPRQLDDEAAKLLAARLAQEGVKLHLGKKVDTILGEDRAASVRLTDGTQLPGELVVVSVGVAPNLALARTVGCEVGRGITVDDRLATTVEGVFAAGDCAEHRRRVYGIWPVAIEQGTLAGMAAAGKEVKYEGSIAWNVLKVIGTPVFSIGVIQPQAPAQRESASRREGVYQKVVMEDRHIIGAVLFGDDSLRNAIEEAIRSLREFPPSNAPQLSADEVFRSLARS